MKTISLSTTTYDLLGSVFLDNIDSSVQLQGISRRAVRTMTLDGGAYVTDSGFSDADRTLDVTLSNGTQAQFDAITYLVKNYSTLVVITEAGAFSGVITEFTDAARGSRLKILISGTL